MYTKTFVGETLDGTLKEIKKELGPGAVILKTMTNTGLKGRLKKNKYEIVAAINEADYVKKQKIESVLPEAEKQIFQNSSATNMSKIMNGYGNLAINRPVMKNKSTGMASQGLDDFLGPIEIPTSYEKPEMIETTKSIDYSIIEDLKEKLNAKLDNMKKHIDARLNVLETTNPSALKMLLENLRSMRIHEKFIQEWIVELGKDNLPMDYQHLSGMKEHLIHYMGQCIHTRSPIISERENTVNVFLAAVGQNSSSLMIKMIGQFRNSRILCLEEDIEKFKLAKILFDTKIDTFNDEKEIISFCRRNSSDNNHTFIYLPIKKISYQNIVKYINAVKNSYSNVEVFMNLSAIHTHEYNQQLIEQYKQHVDGININFLDLCSHFSGIFNLSYLNSKIPLKYFGIGPVMPDDIELASMERIISRIMPLE